MNDIKKQLIAKIGDTSDRATRVQQQVNLKKSRGSSHIVKKEQWAYYSTIVAFIGLLAFSIYIIPSALNKEDSQLSEPEPPELVVPNEDDIDEEGDEGVFLEKGEYYEELIQYFPSDGAEAIFLGGFENGGYKTQTFWLNDYYIQQITSNDGAITEQIYRVNGEQVELVYRENIDGSTPSQLTMEELNELPMIEVVFKAPIEVGSVYGDWTVTALSAKVTTTYGNFSNVLEVEHVVDNFRTKKYFAPGFGLVKLVSESFHERSGKYDTGMMDDLSEFNLPEAEKIATPAHFDTHVVSNFEPTFHTPWKPSPGRMQQVTIEGKGEQAGEEGEAVLVIENLETNESAIYKLKDNEDGQYTPKVVEWIDENRLFVIIGYAHGMVTTGGKLYELNIQDNIVTPIIEELAPREEIMSLTINEDGTFTYQKHVYDNDDFNYDEAHIEESTLTIPTANR